MKPIRSRRKHSYYDDFQSDPAASSRRRDAKRMEQHEAGLAAWGREIEAEERKHPVAATATTATERLEALALCR